MFFSGFYCSSFGLSSVSGPCDAGYYCPVGSKVSNEIICPSGFHCPTGSDVPRSCAPGFYTNTTGNANCLMCPEGLYCIPVTWKEDLLSNETIGYNTCPAGYYCPLQTGGVQRKCPSGTFSNATGLRNIDQCQSCTPGHYCEGEGLKKPSGECDPGYYCTIGNLFSNDKENVRFTLHESTSVKACNFMKTSI